MNDELLEKYLTNALSPAGQEELKRELEQEANRRRFVEYLLEWSVTADIARQMASVEFQASPRDPRRSHGHAAAAPRRESRKPAWIVAFATAAVLLVAILLQILSRPGPKENTVPPPGESARADIPAPPPREVPGKTDPVSPSPPPLPAPPSMPPKESPETAAPVPPETGPRTLEEPPLPRPADRPADGPRPSAVAVVQIAETRGEAAVLKSGESLPAAPGQPLVMDSGIRTGPDGAVSFAFVDGTRVEVGPDTLIRGIADGPSGKRMEISQGSLAADVARQPSGRPMVFLTPVAETVVLGTRLRLSVTAEATKLEVLEGRVRLLRPSDRTAVEVRAGYQAAARASGPLAATRSSRFVRGVNLNGEAVTIEGERWLSHAAALSSGLSFSVEPEITTTFVQPRPACDEDTARMLNTAVFKGAANLTISQTLPNGLYDVCLWVMENLNPNHRSFDIRVEGRTVARDVGARARLGDWVKLGPYRTAVADGSLTIELLQGRTDPHLMGFAVFSAGNP